MAANGLSGAYFLFVTPRRASLSFTASVFLLAAVLLLAEPGGVRGGEASLDKLSADELMQLALVRDEAARTARAHWRHDQELTTDRLDARGQLLGSKVTSRHGVASDGTPGASGSVDGSDTDGDFQVTLDLRRLAGRFDLQREGEGFSKEGERCYLLAFRPRAESQTHASREEKVINQLSGRFWLAKSDLSIVQSEAALSQPVTVAWVASVYRLDFRYRGRRLSGRGAVVPASLVLDLGVEAPLYHSRQRQTTTMTNYQPEPPDGDGR